MRVSSELSKSVGQLPSNPLHAADLTKVKSTIKGSARFKIVFRLP